MKGMPFPFDFQGKGELDSYIFLQKNQSFPTNNFFSADFPPFFSEKNCIFGTSCNSNSFGESKSVLDSATLSSSHGGGSGCASAVGGGGDSSPSPKWHRQQLDSATATSCSNLAAAREESSNLWTIGGGGGGGSLAMEDWESVLKSDVSQAGQEQSVLRWIIGDAAEDSDKVVHHLGGGGNNEALEFNFNCNNGGGFGAVDQESFIIGGVNPPILDISSNLLNPNLPFDSSSSSFDQQNPLLLPPRSKRHNPVFRVTDYSSPGNQISKGYFYSSSPQLSNPIRFLPHYKPGPIIATEQQNPREEFGQQCNNDPQNSIADNLYEAAELLHTGNIALAREILARLNHHHQFLSPLGKQQPFQRSAFYCKEALQKLLIISDDDVMIQSTVSSTPFNLASKIGAHKSFSEISPVAQFSNFTCNQAILEAVEGLERVHVLDFDLGHGGQWASLMQELSLRGPRSVKITSLPSSPSNQDHQLELALACENLIEFASEVNIPFEFDIVGFDPSNPGSWASHFRRSSDEGIVVNLPVRVLAAVPYSTLGFLKQLSPRIIVSVDRGFDGTDVTFAGHVAHVLRAHANLLESLEAANGSNNGDSLQRIERFLLQPGIEKLVGDGFRNRGKTKQRHSLFSCGFSPVEFSDFAESLAECIAKRTPVRGFTVERRQCCLVLSWQGKELVSVSAWR